VASGIDAALKILNRKGKLKGRMPAVVAMGGDGATPGPWSGATTSPTSAGTTKPT
jgi:hypothetical protein